jgi:putative transposase
MPRANRYILPGYVYHLTRRCHNRKFLFRFRLDRNEYCDRLRSAIRKHRIDLFDYCVPAGYGMMTPLPFSNTILVP